MARQANSRDHIFAEFLGGKECTPACTSCNGTFGHTFEAAAFDHLRDLMFILRLSGMRTPKPMTWKRIGVGIGGEPYDIDQDLSATPSIPSIERDASGTIVSARGNETHVRQIAKSLERRGGKSRIICDEPVTINSGQFHVRYPLGDDIRRTCIKMSIAGARKMDVRDFADARARSYLLLAEASDACPVRIAIDQYAALDRQRPRAGHLIYVQACSLERRVYSIVQFFSAIQFYCELACDYEETDWAILATHDPVSHEETYAFVAPLDYPLPERFVPRNLEECFLERLERLRLELVDLYGDDATLAFGRTAQEAGRLTHALRPAASRN
jgi:hypothetical protein